MMMPASIPSPSVGVWWLGPIPLRAYGLLMVSGMVLAVWWTSRRYGARRGNPDLAFDMALWAIPLGIIGARLYHVVTTPELYFGQNGNLLQALEIWKGGLGIWGGVAGGALGAWIALKRKGQRIGPIADAVAPTLLVAQALGRWGNYFNQELFGSPTTLPWGLEIDDAHLPMGYTSGTLFHPTFLYECLWNLAMAGALIWWDHRRTFAGRKPSRDGSTKLGQKPLFAGQLFGLYVMAYTAGRVWIEYLRIDEAHYVFGLRLNVWTSILVFILGAVVFVVAGRLKQPTTVILDEQKDTAELSDSAYDGDQLATDHAATVGDSDKITGNEDVTQH